MLVSQLPEKLDKQARRGTPQDLVHLPRPNVRPGDDYVA